MSALIVPRPPMGFARPATDPDRAAPSPAEQMDLLARARSLQSAETAGHHQLPLRGKHLGLLCADATQAQALLFSEAASGLGAHVAHIGMSLTESSGDQEIAHTARLLGRLYDAVECQGLPSALVRRMAEAAGITVYDGLALNEALIGPLAEQLGGGAADLARNRRFALQALLLSTLE